MAIQRCLFGEAKALEKVVKWQDGRRAVGSISATAQAELPADAYASGPEPFGAEFTEGASFEEEGDTWTETRPLSEAEKTALLRGIIRANIISEVAATRLAKGQRLMDRRRPDLKYRQEREKDLLKKTESFAGPHRVRPSLLRPIASAAGLALGSLASVLPKTASAAISGGVQEAMVEQYNDQLRELRLHDLADVSNTLRETIRELRDEERAPQDAVQAPDIMKMQRPQELNADEILAGVVKYGMKGLFALGAKV